MPAMRQSPSVLPLQYLLSTATWRVTERCPRGSRIRHHADCGCSFDSNIVRALRRGPRLQDVPRQNGRMDQSRDSSEWLKNAVAAAVTARKKHASRLVKAG